MDPVKKEKKKIKKLVIDSGAFLKKIKVQDFGEELFTVEDFVHELKDEEALHSILNLFPQLNYRKPQSSSIKFIEEFTEKTGELGSLSSLDIKILALTYELEVEAKGGSDHLRTEPVQRKPVANTVNTFRPLVQKNAEQVRNAEQVKKKQRNAEQVRNAVQDGNAEQMKKKEIVYIYDINILDYYLSSNFVLCGEDIGSYDFNLFSRLISRYRHLKAAKTYFCNIKNKYSMDFFERLCLHYDIVYSNTVKRNKELCAYPDSSSESSNCESTRKKCFHPKKCHTYDGCIIKIQCDHRRIDDNWIGGIRNTKYNKYCDYENYEAINWELLKVAKNFYYFCEKKIYFKIWFFKVLREFKIKNLHDEEKPFQENEILIKKILKDLREFDDHTKEEESKTSTFFISDSEDHLNVSTSSDVASLTKAVSSLNISTDLNAVKVACITTNFAMQSTLLHIGLSAIGVDGKLIKSLRMYMIRCYICRAFNSDVEKMYCYKCGYKTLKKVPYTLNPDGTKYIWESHRPITKREVGEKRVRNSHQRVPQMLPNNNPVLEGYLTSGGGTSGRVSTMLAENCGFSLEASKYRGTFYFKKNNLTG